MLSDWEDILKIRSQIKPDINAVLARQDFMRTFKIFNVVGTNGKGSVSNFIAQGLQSVGHKVGLFTSPHLISPNERIRVNGTPISDAETRAILKKLAPENLDECNFFAITFIIALLYFQQANCTFVVLEAGIGGKHDVTNFFNDSAEYGVVTSIAYDHVDILGHTLEKIATDKAGIIGPKMTFFTPSALKEDIKALFLAQKAAEHISINNDGPTYQIRNAKLVAGVLKALGITDFHDFVLPLGRTQVIKAPSGATTIVDVGHNEEGVLASLTQIGALKLSYDTVLIAIKRTKDFAKIMAAFKGKRILVHQVNELFFSADELGADEEVKDPAAFYTAQKSNTLYIGSFSLAEIILRTYLQKNPS